MCYLQLNCFLYTCFKNRKCTPFLKKAFSNRSNKTDINALFLNNKNKVNMITLDYESDNLLTKQDSKNGKVF